METSRYRFVIKHWDGHYSLYFDTEEEGWAKVEQDKLDVQDVYKVPAKRVRTATRYTFNEPSDEEFKRLKNSLVRWLVRVEQVECTRPKMSEVVEWKERFEQKGWPLPLGIRVRLEGKIRVLEG